VVAWPAAIAAFAVGPLLQGGSFTYGQLCIDICEPLATIQARAPDLGVNAMLGAYVNSLLTCGLLTIVLWGPTLFIAWLVGRRAGLRGHGAREVLLAIAWAVANLASILWVPGPFIVLVVGVTIWALVLRRFEPISPVARPTAAEP
jgi:hypothetical protein